MKWLDSAWWHGMETLIGLECPLDPAGQYRVLRLQKDQHRIKVRDAQELHGMDAAQAYLTQHPSAPIVLLLSGDFVMERMLAAETKEHPVSAVLGVAVEDAAQFDWMQFPGAKGQTMVALIRKDALEACAARFPTHQSRIITAVFSPAVCAVLAAQVAGDGDAPHLLLDIAGRQYALLAGQLTTAAALQRENYTELDERALCLSLQIADGFAYAYASLIYTWQQAAQQVREMPIAQRWVDYQAESRLKQIAVMAAIGLAIWFAGLFSFRIQGERKKSELETQYSQNLPVLNALQRLDTRIAAMEDLRTRLGSQTLKPTQVARHLDQLAQRVPGEIQLLEIISGPDEEDYKRQGVREPQDQQLLLRGESVQSAPISVFSDALAHWQAVSDFTVVRSEMNFQSNRYEFVFMMNLDVAVLEEEPQN